MSQAHPRLDPPPRASQPRLHPRRPPLRRGVDEVQLGVGAQAIVLRGLSAGQVAVLERLDGSRSRAQLHDLAAHFGDPPQVVEELLTLLSQAGALADPGSERVDLLGHRRTHRRRVLVGGPDALTDRLARALRLAEVDDVLVGPLALDQAELALRDHDGTVGYRHGRPDLVVLSAFDAIDPAEAAPWSRHGIAHLAVTTEGDRIVIGPLVVPPPHGDTTCVQCLELHRCDRDAGRATVLAQTTRPTRQVAGPGHGAEGLTAVLGPGGPVRSTPLEPALLSAAAAMTALVVAAYLGGDCLPDGVTVELTSPWPRLDHRRWSRHPQCPHHAAAVTGAPEPAVRCVVGGPATAGGQ